MTNPLKWFRFVLTDEENQWDLGILMWFGGFALFLYKGFMAPAPFDYISFGAGLGGVCGAGAALRWIKTKEIATHAEIVDAHEAGNCPQHPPGGSL